MLICLNSRLNYQLTEIEYLITKYFHTYIFKQHLEKTYLLTRAPNEDLNQHVQADLSLRWAHMCASTFSEVADRLFQENRL